MAQRYSSDDEPDDTGQNAFHEADEEWTGRRVVLRDGKGQEIPYRHRGQLVDQARIRILEPFWESENQRLDYLFAIEETRGMLPSERLEAIRKRFGGGGEVKPMPRARQTRRRRDEELQKLREQVARDRVTGEAS